MASGYVLTSTMATSVLVGRIGVIKGLAFAAVTGGLLYLLLRAREKTSKQESGFPVGRRLVLVFVALALVVPLIGIAITLLYRPQIEREANANLEAIARLKAEQIENWMAERQGDSEVLAGDVNLAKLVGRFVQQRQDAGLSRLILERFEQLRGGYHYTKILLLDTSGRLLLLTGEEMTTAPALPGLLSETLESKRVQRRDIYRDREGHIHLEWMVPITVPDGQGKRAVAVIVLRATAQDFLFPLIQTWPTASPSGETLLVRREGDSVVYLNQLRHLQGTALRLTRSLTDSELPAAIAIRSEKPGTIQGTDYHGTSVLAAYRPVKGTNWHLVAKADHAEIMAPLRNLVVWVSLIALAAIALVSAALLVLWRQQQHIYRLEVRARSTAAIERSEQHFRSLFENMLEGYAHCRILYREGVPEDFVYLEINRAFETMTGLKDVVGKRANEVIPGFLESNPELSEIYDRVAQSRQPEQFEMYLGALEMWFAISVYCPEREHFVAIFDNITARKQLEQQLSRRLRHLDVMERISRISLDSQSVEELLGRVLDEILDVFNADRAWFLYPCDPDAPSWSVPMERTRPEWPGAFARGMVLPMTPEVAEVFRELLASTEPLPYGPAAHYIPAAVAEQFSIRSQIQMALRPRVGSPWAIGLHHCTQARAYDEDELLIFKDIGQRVADALSSVIILKNLRESEENLNRAQAVGQIGSWLFNPSTNRLEWSAETYRMFDVPRQQAIDFETFVAAIHPGDRDFVLRAWGEAMTGASYDIEHRIVVGGQVRWVRERAQIERDTEGRPLASIGTVQDITERKAAETKIQRLTQLYAALSQCNEAIVRSTSEEELFPQICNSAVEFGGMKMAWIGLVDEARKLVKPVVSCGDGTEYLDGIRISVEAGDPYARDPAGVAIRNNQPQWMQDFQHDMLDTPWYERILRFGWGSAASLPLLRDRVVIGAFTLYSSEVNAFDENARNLLVEMARDISFALDSFDRETERKQVALILAESEQRFRSLVEQSLAGIYIIQDGRFVYVNPRFAEIFGYASASELVGVDPLTLVAEQDRGIVAENIRSRIQGEMQSISYGFTAVRKDGSLIDVGVQGARAMRGGRPAIIGLLQDVSEKKRAEEQIQSYVAKLEDSFLHTIEVATTLVEMRDPYTAGHEKRVAQIAVAIGIELGLEENSLDGLRIGGYIHDIGKIIVPAEILSKPGSLSPAEYELIKGHPQAGYDILKSVDLPWPVAEIAHQHHERLDGSGYPRGLKGDEILLEARITAVADVVEAMSSHRPYRPGIGLEQALAEIEQGSGSRYCPAAVGACLCLFREKGYELPQ